MTLTDDGRLYLIDRRSLRGTMSWREGKWVRHESGYVSASQPILLGERKVTLADLLPRDDSRGRTDSGSRARIADPAGGVHGPGHSPGRPEEIA